MSDQARTYSQQDLDQLKRMQQAAVTLANGFEAFPELEVEAEVVGDLEVWSHAIAELVDSVVPSDKSLTFAALAVGQHFYCFAPGQPFTIRAQWVKTTPVSGAITRGGDDKGQRAKWSQSFSAHRKVWLA